MATPDDAITGLLHRIRDGDKQAENDLLAIVYNELRQLAHRLMRAERPGHSLQATELVHEAYVRLMRPASDVDWQDRTHFFAIASRQMRRLLVDHARAANAQKRPRPLAKLSLESAIVYTDDLAYELVGLDQALTRLASWDERQSRIVEMRFFGDLTIEEIAGVLGLSARQVKRDWQMARAWLYKQLKDGGIDESRAMGTS